jgi:rRNA-processing protein FCF1
VVAVVEGAARGAAAPEVARVNEQPTDRPAVEVIEAERDGDSAIVAMTDKLLNTVPSASPETAGRAEVVFVVTADRGLRRRLPPDAISVGPEWLNRLIGR